MKNRFRRKVLYQAALVVRFFLRKFPPSWGIAFGALLGKTTFWLLPKERDKTVDHLTLAFGGQRSVEDLTKVGESIFRNLGKTAAELIYFPAITKSTLSRWVSCDGLSKLDQVLQKGKGGIILVAHFGNWELLARSLALLGYGGVIIVRRVYDERFDRLLKEIREVDGIRFVDRGASPKEMLRALHQNQFLGILADQDIDSVDGIFVSFFGREAYTPIGPARFSVTTGAPVIPCFMIREGRRHRLVIEDPIFAPEGGEKNEAIRRITEQWMAVTESYIRKFPDQWVWMHRRWKTQKDRPKTEDQRPSVGDGRDRPLQCGCFLLMLFLVLYLTASLGFCAEEKSIPDQEVHSFSFTGYSKEGKPEWEVQGPKAVLEGDIATLDKPTLQSNGKTQMTVTSDHGTYNRQTAQAHLEENVFAKTSDGATLKTDSLVWDGATKKLSTEDHLTIEKDSVHTEGKGAEANVDLKKITLREEVKVTMSPNLEITSKGPMEFDYNSHHAVFHDEVKAVDEQGELSADQMDVTFEPETNHVREVIATGSVRIKRGDNISYSDRAVYDAKNGKVTLLGKPKLVIKPEEEKARAFIGNQSPR